MIPRPLQTREYTQSVQAESGATPTTDHDPSTTRSQPAKLLAIVGESVLRRPFGGTDVLRRQLEHLHTAAAENRRTIRVLPSGQKITTGPFTLLRLPDLSPVICLEHLTCTLFLEQPHDIDAYEHAMKHLDQNALDEAHSLELISSIAKTLEPAVGHID
jgi:hypothetical protein